MRNREVPLVIRSLRFGNSNVAHFQSIGSCSGLQVLDVSCNQVELFPLELGQLKLKEFYFENNPLLPHIPVPAEQECEVLPLRVSELSSHVSTSCS